MRASAALLGLVVLLAVPRPSLGQPADATAIELGKLNATLREIVDLLEKQDRASDLQLLMKRLELADARRAASEAALKAAQTEQRSLEAQKGQLELRVKMAAARARDAREGSPEADEMELYTQSELARIRKRLTELANELVVLDADVAAKRRDVDDWQSVLDRRLNGL